MILLAVLAGLYAIGAIGYYKMSHKMIIENEETKALMSTYPMVYKILLSGLSLVWPVMLFWSLVKEASR